MFLEQGVLRPQPLGRQVSPRRSNRSHKKQGLTIDKIQRLLDTGEPRICITRSLGGIGDVLMTTPTVKALKVKWPNSHITYATDFKYMDGALRDILLYNPYIDELVQYQVAKAQEYDFSTDITSVCIGRENSGEPNVPNRIDLFAEYVGVSLAETGHLPVYIVSDEEKQWAKEKLSRYPRRRSDSPRIGIQVRSSTLSRSWALSNVRDLAIKLYHELGAQVVVFDSSHGQGPREDWNISGIIAIKDYKIRQIAALINEMDLMVAPDSGLMHIAGALNKRIVSIWAGTDPNARINYYPNAVAIAKNNYTCFPCWYHASACNNSYACMKSITVDEVFYETAKRIDYPIVDGGTQTSDTICIRRDVGGYGDVVCTTCAIEDLARRKPDKKLIVAMPDKYHCVFDNNPHIDKCITLYKEPIPPDAAVYNLTTIDAKAEVATLNASRPVNFTRSQTYVKHVGGSDCGAPDIYIPKLYVTEDETNWARDKFMSDRKLKYIVTALETAEVYRNWPRDRYIELFKLAEKKHPDWRFVLVGNLRSEEQLVGNVIDAAGFNFRGTIKTVSAADAVLTPDTSILHVAAALNKPCVTLFGPIEAEARCKFYKNIHCIRKKLDCAPCWRNSSIACKHADKTTLDGYSYCIEVIKPIQVLDTLESICQN